MRHTSLTFERPEANSEPVHFFIFMDNGMAFSSVGGMQLSMSRPAYTRVLGSEKVLDLL